MNRDTEGYVFEKTIEIDASPELVYRFFTDKELLERWLCHRAEVDLRTGGDYTFNLTGEDITRGTFVELDPGKRLVMTWGFEEPGATTLEITFVAHGKGTRVTLRHSEFASSDSRDAHARGWAHYLDRLDTAAPGGDPGPDTWLAGGDDEGSQSEA